MIDHIITCLAIAAYLVERLFSWLRERAWREERRELCSRIQSGSLREYELSRLAERAASGGGRTTSKGRKSLPQAEEDTSAAAVAFAAVEAQDAARGLGID